MRVHLLRALLTSLILAALAHAAPVRLRCEAVQNPLGIDTPTPHLSWQSDSAERDWIQSAYQILVASTGDRLRRGSADVWDSGKVKSAESVGIPYGGPKLEARKRYYWAVRVWDAKGRASTSPEIAWWETGLSATDWKAKWIAWENPDEDADRAGIRWIWVAGQDGLGMAPKTVAEFRVDVDVPEKPRDATLFLLARGAFVATVNGHEVGAKRDWHEFDREDVTHQLVAGKNSIEVTVTVAAPNASGPEAAAKPQKAALAGLLKITRSDGTITRVSTDGHGKGGWQASLPGNPPTWSRT